MKPIASKLFILLGLLVASVANGQPTTKRSSAEEAKASPEVATSSGDKVKGDDVVINTLGDGLVASSAKSSSDRHLYVDQQQQLVELRGVEEQTGSGEPAASPKPEPRNEQEEQGQQEQMLLEQRQPGLEMTQLSSLNQDFQSTSSSTTQSPITTSSSSSSTTTTTSPQMVQNQVQAPATGSYNNWSIQQQQMPPAGQSQQFSSLTPASYTNSNAHPNSINAIINSNEPQQMQLIPQQQQQQMTMSVNGQPMQLVVNSNGVSGLAAGGQNGRRISISGWLKGISSMLANIFNRREHGALMASASANNLGHWVPFGPNAPHWLSQAQTALQLQQQQFQQQFGSNPLQAASTRFASYLQAPQQQVTSGQQPTTMTITLQPAGTLQQQQPAGLSYQSMPTGSGDLQQSGSSASYTQIQAPAQQQPAQAFQQLTYQPGNQQQQQQASKSSPQSPELKQQQSSINQTRFGRSSAASSSSNLPLAHYSRQQQVQQNAEQRA